MVKNTPYIKQYDTNGSLLNPIGDGYFSAFPSRRERRAHKNKPPLYGCGRNVPITYTPAGVYKRVRQVVKDAKGNIWLNKDGQRRVIEHYMLIH